MEARAYSVELLQQLPGDRSLRGFEIDEFRPEFVVTEGKAPEVRAFLDKHGYEGIERYRPFDLVNEYYRRRGPESGSP